MKAEGHGELASTAVGTKKIPLWILTFDHTIPVSTVKGELLSAQY